MPDYTTVGCRNCKKIFDFSINCTILITMNTVSKKFFSLLISTLLVLGSVVPSFSSIEKNGNAFGNVLDKKILSSFKVTDSYKAGSKNFVVWIQDLHNDFVTQEKIYNVLENLSNKSYFEIYGEGVVDNSLDVSILDSIPNEKIRKETIDNLFKSSVLSACEYFVLTDKKNHVNGIENKKEYLENLSILDKIDNSKTFNNYIADNIIKQIDNLKQQNVVERVLSLQIAKLNDLDVPNQFPNLQKYQTVSKKLSEIDTKKLNSQFKSFTKQAKDNFDLYNMLKTKSDYGYAQIYDYINAKMPEMSKNNKEFMNYLQANKILSEINSVNLLYENESFVKQLLDNESLDQRERELIDLGNFAKDLKDLINASILPSHYLSLKENKRYFSTLLKKYLSKDLLVFALHLLNNDDFFKFFDTNINRNEIFVEKLQKKDSNKIVVAGGFHSDITKKLRELNISYMVLTPNINIANAFNNLFSTTLKYGTDEQIAKNLMSIISSWKIFFTNSQDFQNEINKWIENSEELKNKLLVTIDSKENIMSVSYGNVTISQTFIADKTVGEETILSKKQQTIVTDDILKVAKQHYLFGQDVEVKISDDDSLLDNMIAMNFEIIDEKPVVFVNRKFLSALYTNPYLIQPSVKLFYYLSSEIADTDSFISFVSNNYEDLQEIYNVTRNLKDIKPSLSFTIKSNLKRAINTLKASVNNYRKAENIRELGEDELRTEDERNMAQALKQATIARQTRGFLTSFVQPPIGAFLVNAEGITGRNYNNTNSVLHAETLTFIDFLKNYIQEYEKTLSGELTEKGEFLTELLELARINGENINNKIFQNRPALLENLGIQIDYSQKRDIDMVFTESNAVLKFVSMQLGNPLASATLYCTLAPCNKCSKTMAALGIDKLVYGSYSVNKSHKSINTVLNAGIKVVDGILLKQCDERIVNYRFMNLSMFRTKIASGIQSVRRFFSNFYRKTDKMLNYLIANISFSETKILDLKYAFLELQQKIDWNDLQTNPEALDKLIDTLKQLDAYEDVVKRASIIYVIKNKCYIKIENGNIVFYNKENKKMDFYINVAGKFVMSKNYSYKMGKLAKVMNFADIDDNLALRNTPFGRDMQAVFSTLTLYGIGQPIPITGNTLKLTEKRLNPLGIQIMDLLPEIYVENAAMQFTVKDGIYTNNQSYMTDIAKSVLEPEVMDYLKNLFGNLQQEWYDNFVLFIEQTKQLRKQSDATYEDFMNTLLKQRPDFKEIDSVAKVWGSLTRHQAQVELNRIYQTAIQKGTDIERFKEVMKTMSLLEIARLYFSKDENDQKESVGIRQAIEAVESGEDLNTNVESLVRCVVTAFRPTLVREQVAKYYKQIIQKKYPDLEIISTGQTTISVYKKGINKYIPLRQALNSGVLASDVIYTGDEFNIGGVDYPIYILQQEKGNQDMVVISTNGKPFEGTFISLSQLEGFDKTMTVDGNIKRNISVQRMILSIIEENIDAIATDSEYEPAQVAQELKSRIFSRNVLDFEAEMRQSEIPSISDMLKAG